MRVVFLPFRYLRIVLQSALLALGQLWVHKTRAALTTLGILIGVASVSAVIAALTGLRTRVLSEFETIGTKRIAVMPRRPATGPYRYPSSDINFYPEQIEGLLEHCPSVEAVARYQWTSAPASRGSKVIDNVSITGIDPVWHKCENRSVSIGREFSLIDVEKGAQVCIVTEEVTEQLNLDRDCTGQQIIIGKRTYRIVGVLEPPIERMFGRGGGEVPNIYVPFTTIYERRWGIAFEALAKSPEVAEEAKAEITFFLRGRRGMGPGEPANFRVETVQRALEQFEGAARAITAVAGGIVAISLLVGGIGIMNIMLVSVSERTREIGLRKAVGASPFAILFQFLVEAVVLCLVGGLAGLGFGELLTLAMANIPGSPLEEAYIPVWAVALSFGFAAGVGLIFGIFPAIKAACLNPIEALRHE